MKSLYISHIRPLLEYSSVVWNTGYIGDTKLLESIQRRWTRNIEGLENLSYGERLKALGLLCHLFSVYGRLLKADLIDCWKILHGTAPFVPSRLFHQAPAVGTRGHAYKLAHSNCSLECQRRFFSMRVDSAIWPLLPDSLPSSIVELYNLDPFKAALKDFLGDRLYGNSVL